LNATSDIPAPTISWQRSLLLFLAVFVLAVPQAAMLPLLDRDEPRFAEASREMIQRDNFIVPTFNNHPRYDKPPLIYWCQIIAYKIFGENAFAARLPSLVATAATAVLIYTWGIRLGSEKVGLGAALSYAFCLQTLQQGRVATADALLIFFMTLTAFAGWMLIRPRKSKTISTPCYAAIVIGIAAGFLAKGPEALLPVIPILWFGVGRRWGVTVSLLLGLGLVLFWAIPAYIQTNGAYWSRGLNSGIGQRYFEPLQSHGGSLFLWFPYYFLLFWVSALPWSVPLLLRFRKLLFPWWTDFADDYLLLNGAIIFVVFTFMATKLPHYTLPAFPLLALFFVRRWQAAGFAPGTFVKIGWITGGIFALAASIAIPLALAHHASPSPVGDLVRAAGDNLKPDTQFAAMDFQEPTAIWEMRRVCQGFAQPVSTQNLDSFLNEPGSHAVVLTPTLEPEIVLEARSKSALGWKIYETRGFDAAKLRFLDLMLIVKP
jgi:4-amino-4-deoxy-L-arabinose transferase-like glycosyltransferase